MSRLDPAAFIRMNLPVATVPGIPEIRLHKARPTSGLMRLAREDEDGFGAPYWAHYWAGGLALARYVLDNPAAVAGKRVLDLGAGSGLVGIAAAKAGAREVVAAEVDRYAVAALQLNMRLNSASISVLHSDVTESAPPETDLILVGDLFYAPDLSQRVTAFLDRSSSCGIRALVGDPWRAHLPVSRLTELARYLVTEGGSHATRPSGVFAFTPRPGGGGQSA
jgi:predicted nicotinamide N-methyase